MAENAVMQLHKDPFDDPACQDADSVSKNLRIGEMIAATFYLRAHSPPGA